MRLRSWITSSGPPGPIDIALRLTLVGLLLRPMGPWFVRAPLLLLSMLGLISGAWLRASALWLVLAILVAVRVVVEWPLPDNHIYLLAYWCLAVSLALRFADSSRQLARSSRLLLGLVFAFAVLWKAVLSPDYRDGRFFAVTLVTDDRFSEVVQLIGGLSDAQLRENREYLTPLPEGAELLTPPVLHEPLRFRLLVFSGNVGHPRDGVPGRRALAGAVDAPEAARGPARSGPAFLPDDLCVRPGGRIRVAGDRPRPRHLRARGPLGTGVVRSNVRDGAAVFRSALGVAGFDRTRVAVPPEPQQARVWPDTAPQRNALCGNRFSSC